MRWSRGLWYPSIGTQRRMSLSLSCRVTTHKDDGAIIEDVVLRQERGNDGGMEVYYESGVLEEDGVEVRRTCWFVFVRKG